MFYLPCSRAKYLQMAIVSGIMLPSSICKQGRLLQGKSEKERISSYIDI